ncbi:hypothetical protein GCM10027341_02540 [Spirosoma knui]
MRPYFTALYCLFSITTFAQYEHRAATLTDRNDSTRTGIVKFYDWSKSPESIEFIPARSSSVQTIPVKAIQQLTIQDGPVYEGLYLKVPYYTKAPVRVGDDIVGRIDSTYFLAEVLLESPAVKLYRYFDADAKLRFVVAKYDSLVLLDDIHLSINRRETLYAFNDPAFRKTLSAVLSECPTLNTDNVTYTEASLINLLKEYLSFCRIDSKIYLEQKKFGKAIVGLGTFGSSWTSAQGKAIGYGFAVQVLLPRRLHNVFTLVEIGRYNRKTLIDTETALHLGLYAGQYIGRRAVQGKIYTGLSTVFGPLDTGVGISYRKIFSVETRYPVFAGVLSGFRENGTNYIRPSFTVRAVIPLSSSATK